MSYPPAWKFDLDEPKASADTPDDEFVGGTLDAKWTVVDGTLGTCSLTYGGGDRYDLTTRDSWLLMQVDNGNHVKLRQDYTLPDGASIVIKTAPSAMADAQSGIANNEMQVGISLNDSDTDYLSGAQVNMAWDTGPEGWRVVYNDNSGSAKSTPSATGETGAPMAQAMYLRVLRSGLTYYGYWSTDGTAWFPLASFAKAGALNNIWICAVSVATFGDPTPIQAVDWIRQGGNGVDPW